MAKEFPRDILISPGFGAGWSTWAHNDNQRQEIAEYQPIINFLNKGGSRSSPKFRKLIEEAEEKFDCYTGGAGDLEVVTVYGPYRIEEYDGHESVLEMNDKDLWTF